MAAARAESPLTYTIVLVASLIAVAHAAIFVRMADADPLVTAAYRMLIASAVLLPVAAVTARQEITRLNKREWRLIGWAAVFLALHFASWIASLDFTSMAGGILFVGFLLLAEAARRTIGIVAFVTLVYSGAAILLWAAVLALDLPVVGLSLETYLAFIGLGLVSQIIGHTGFNWAVRAISPMVLALLFLTEPLLSTALGWFYFGEGFARETGIGGVLILSAIYLGVRARGTPIAEQTG